MSESGSPNAGDRSKTHALCRACHLVCSLVVEIEDGRPVKIYGDKDNPISHGFTCIRGREAGKYATLPSRLKSSVERRPDGSFQAISSDEAVEKVANKLSAIIAEHGPRSVAVYAGSFCGMNTATNQFTTAMMDAIGSPMTFTPESIDQPGKPIANALHGRWLGGVMRHIDGFDAVLLFGSNPLVAGGGPFGTAMAHNLHEAKKKGTKLFVCDPRCSETAQKADVHLQVRPAEDAAVIAGIIRIILSEGLHDKEFVDNEANGLDDLLRAVAPFTPDYVEARADISASDLITVAREYASARRGLAHFGTGPNMSGRGTLCEYLGRCLTTICGHWPRAGEVVGNPGVLVKFDRYIAASPGPTPAEGLGETLRVHGLSKSATGMPTAALPDEILTPGEGQVRALIVIGGNPMVAFPDQEKTFKAMQALDLLVCIDPHLSATARLAHYTLAPTVFLEAAGVAGFWEQILAYGTIYGFDVPYQQYTPALFEPPPGSDVLDEWEYIYKVAQKMGLQLAINSAAVTGLYSEPASGESDDSIETSTRLDMSQDITADEAWDYSFRGSPVSYQEVKLKARAGHIFDLPEKRIGDKPEGWTGRFDIGNQSMMDELGEVALEASGAIPHSRPFRLISRRLKDTFNSCWLEHKPLKRKWRYNPAFMHPSDIDTAGLRAGDAIRIESDMASILGIVEADPDVKTGCISMSHGWGSNPDEPDDPRGLGGTTSRLCDTTSNCDPISWIPLMSAIPVTVYPTDERSSAA